MITNRFEAVGVGMTYDTNRAAARAVLPLRPEPVQTLVATFHDGDGTAYTTVVRRWNSVAAARCRLCPDCTAKVGCDQQAVCIVTVIGTIDAESAPLYSSSE